MPNIKSAVALLSGGMDSATLLYYLANQGCRVYPLSVHYGQRHARELAAAAAICERLGVPHTVCDLSNIKPLLRGSSQTDDVAVPEGHYEDPVMRLTVVPNRNMILLAVASAMAIGNGSRTVAYAAHAGDHAVYPDCRPEFVEALQAALHLCHYDGGVDLYTPFLGQTKAQIADLGTTLKVPYELTYSCLAKGTLVQTLRGQEPIEKLIPGRWVWGFGEEGWIPAQVESVFYQGTKPTYDIILDDRVGRISSITATGDHLLLLRDGGYIRVDRLVPGASLLTATIQKVRSKLTNKETYYGMVPLHSHWKEKREYIHRIAAKFFGISGELIHHIDGDVQNNDPENLQGMTIGEHTILERKGVVRNPIASQKQSTTMLQIWAARSPAEKAKIRRAVSDGRNLQIMQKRANAGNHRVVAIIPTDKRESVWDIQTTTRNFALASGVFAHNCYAGRPLHCGLCGTCCERRLCFEEVGLHDSVDYECSLAETKAKMGYPV